MQCIASRGYHHFNRSVTDGCNYAINAQKVFKGNFSAMQFQLLYKLIDRPTDCIGGGAGQCMKGPT